MFILQLLEGNFAKEVSHEMDGLIFQPTGVSIFVSVCVYVYVYTCTCIYVYPCTHMHVYIKYSFLRYVYLGLISAIISFSLKQMVHYKIKYFLYIKYILQQNEQLFAFDLSQEINTTDHFIFQGSYQSFIIISFLTTLAR